MPSSSLSKALYIAASDTIMMKLGYSLFYYRKGQLCHRCLTDIDYLDQQSHLSEGPEDFEELMPENDVHDDDQDSSIMKEIMNATPPYKTKYEMDVNVSSEKIHPLFEAFFVIIIEIWICVSLTFHFSEFSD